MTLTLDLPPDLSEAQVRLELAVALFQREALSLGRAAEVAGLSYRAFWDELTSRGIPVIVYDDDEDWRQELAGIRALIDARASERVSTSET